MASMRVQSADRVVLRQRGAVLVPVAVWAFCALALLDAVLEGTPGYAARTAVLMTGIAYAVWLVLASPCLVVDRAGLRVVNPLRVHDVPFAALLDVRVRGLVSLLVRSDSARPHVVTSWNAPGVPRGGGVARGIVPATVDRPWSAWGREHDADASSRMTTAWRWRPILLLGLLVGVNVTIWCR